MSFIGNQIQQMMINKITQSNPKITPFINRIQSGENYIEVFKDAISKGAITQRQFNQVKNMLPKIGQQYGIKITQQDISNLESVFNVNRENISNFNGFRF